MTIRGNQVPVFSVANERRAVAPQPCTNFDRARLRPLSGTDAHEFLELDQNVGPLARSRTASPGGGTALLNKSQLNSSSMKISRGCST